MSLFGENLQFYRKRENLTQEQLAERLEVSRQTISKWEAGNSYAEMDKLLQICELFFCDMDTLLRKDASALEIKEDQAHREHMKRYRRGVTGGVVILVFSCAAYELLAGFRVGEVFLDTLFWVIMTIGILILVAHGMQDGSYRKNHPLIPDFYTKEEKEMFEKRFPVLITTAIGIILTGMLIFGMNGEYLPLRAGMTEDFYYGLFMVCVAAAVGIFVYSGMKKEEYDVEKYNRSNCPDSEDRKKNAEIDVLCGCIMLAATMIFLVAGLIYNLWESCWIVFVVGGLLCGMVSLILKRKK